MINFFFESLDWSTVISGILAITTIIFLILGYKQMLIWKSQKLFEYYISSMCLLVEIRQCIAMRLKIPLGNKTHELHLLNKSIEVLTKENISFEDIRTIHAYSNHLNIHNENDLHNNIANPYLNKDIDAIKQCDEYEEKLKKGLSKITKNY